MRKSGSEKWFAKKSGLEKWLLPVSGFEKCSFCWSSPVRRLTEACVAHLVPRGPPPWAPPRGPHPRGALGERSCAVWCAPWRSSQCLGRVLLPLFICGWPACRARRRSVAPWPHPRGRTLFSGLIQDSRPASRLRCVPFPRGGLLWLPPSRRRNPFPRPN